MTYSDHFYHGNVDMNSNEPYYKIYKSSKTDLFSVVTMQWFDEPDYYNERFVRNSKGAIHVFEYEQDAIDKMLEWYKPEQLCNKYTSYHNVVRD